MGESYFNYRFGGGGGSAPHAATHALGGTDRLTPADIDYFVGEFEKSGFRGPINRYRNFERDWQLMSGVEDRVIHQPSLFVAGAEDMVLRMFGDCNVDTLVNNMKAVMSDFRGAHIIPNAGHWNQQEAPEATTGVLIDWLATL